jgi:hypothetical protein
MPWAPGSDPYHRPAAVARGLNDPEPGIVELVLRSTLESCPPEATKPLERFISSGGRPAELRALAVRALARAGTGEEQLHRLMNLAAERRMFRGWRLAPKSAVVLAALSSLARYWHGHPDAAGVLSQARAHHDPEVQMAAGARLA